MRALSAHDWLRLGALGLLNPFLYYLILFEAYARLPAQIAQPLNYTWAITLALLAVPILRQRMTLRMFFGMLVSYGGVTILLSQGRLDGFASVDTFGVVLALGSTLVWATYWLATVRTREDPLVMMTASFAVGAFAVGVACQIDIWAADLDLAAARIRRVGRPGRNGRDVPAVAAGATLDRARRPHRAADLPVAVHFATADRPRAWRARTGHVTHWTRSNRRRPVADRPRTSQRYLIAASQAEMAAAISSGESSCRKWLPLTVTSR